jgi:DNA polymerase III delta prime subunit
VSDEFLWVEKYRPNTVDECILPDDLKQTFQKIVDKGEILNMILSGTAGLGKTSVAKAICKELDSDYILINGSEEGNIDTLRGKIKQFASSVSLSGGKKVVILDEADYLNPQSTQPALRGFIEEFSNNCRFILTCNFKNRIIEPLHSRCGVYEFNTTKKDLAGLAGQFMKRLKFIFKQEEIEANDEDIANLIMKFAPDWRRILNEAQRRSREGSLQLNAASSSNEQIFDQIFSYLKDKDFKKMRQWVANNVDIDTSAIFRGVFDAMDDKVESGSIPHLVLILADYQYKDAHVADHELNLVACFTEIMANVKFK